MKTCYQNNVMKIEFMETKSPDQPNDTIMVTFYNEDGSLNDFMTNDYTLQRWQALVKLVEETA